MYYDPTVFKIGGLMVCFAFYANFNEGKKFNKLRSATEIHYLKLVNYCEIGMITNEEITLVYVPHIGIF